jgi:hypothetical protein
MPASSRKRAREFGELHLRRCFCHGRRLRPPHVFLLSSADGFPALVRRLRAGRTPMKSLLIAGLLSALMISQANAQVYYNYPKWDRLNDSARAIYIAGAYDSLISIATSDTASASRHYSKCVVSRQLTTEQLAKNVRAFVATRPRLQNGPVQGGLLIISLSFAARLQIRAPPCPVAVLVTGSKHAILQKPRRSGAQLGIETRQAIPARPDQKENPAEARQVSCSALCMDNPWGDRRGRRGRPAALTHT